MMPDFKTPGERTKWIVDNATMYTAVKFLGRGQYERHEYPSLEEAKVTAKHLAKTHGGRYMIYACAGIFDSYICSVS